MKKDKGFIILIIFVLAVAAVDLSYVIYAAVNISKYSSGQAVLSMKFWDFSLGVIIINAITAALVPAFLIARRIIRGKRMK